MKVVEVMERLGIATKAELARICGVTRACPREWETREGLQGRIPARHWGTLVDEAKRRRKKLSYAELRGN